MKQCKLLKPLRNFWVKFTTFKMCNSSRKIQLRGIKLLSNGSKVVKAIIKLPNFPLVRK